MNGTVVAMGKKAVKSRQGQQKEAKPLHPKSRKAAQIRRKAHRIDGKAQAAAERQHKLDEDTKKLAWFREYLVHILDGGTGYSAAGGQPLDETQAASAQQRHEFTVAEVCSAIEAFTARHDRLIDAWKADLLEAKGKRKGTSAQLAAAAAQRSSSVSSLSPSSSSSSAAAALASAEGAVKKRMGKTAAPVRASRIGNDKRAADLLNEIQLLEEQQRAERSQYEGGGFFAPDLTMKRVVVALRRWDGQGATDFARWRVFRKPHQPHVTLPAAPPQAPAVLNDANNPFGALEVGGDAAMN